MALEIVWTKRAEIGYDNIMKYLQIHFTENEVRNFVSQSNDFLNLLSVFPELLKKTTKRNNVHRGPINENTILTYRINPRKKQIELINIRQARQKPIGQ